MQVSLAESGHYYYCYYFLGFSNRFKSQFSLPYAHFYFYGEQAGSVI